MLAYWYCKEDMTAGSGDEPAWKVGETRSIKGKLKICEWGYHSSPSPVKGLKYITGPILNLVEISKPLANTGHDDKYVSRTRKIIKSVDLSIPLRLLLCDIADMENAKYEQDTGNKVPQVVLDSILAGRKFAAGEITKEEMSAANQALSSSSSSYSSSYSSSSSSSSYYSSYSYYSRWPELAERFNKLALEALENAE